MTDLLNREGVKTSITDALTLPFDHELARQVRRFGFEYEMLPAEYGGSDSGSWCCEDCDGPRPHSYDDDSPAEELAEMAYDRGLTSSSSICNYHCQCDYCEHTRSQPLMTAQEDGSCGIEFVSRIIDLNDFPASEIAEWVQLFQDWKSKGGWMPDGHTSNGNHVHVSSDNDDDADFGSWQNTPLRQRAFDNVNAMYAIFDWTAIAAGGCRTIRGYNPKPSRHNSYGGWLSDRGYGTFEHRLWNTPRDPERLWVSIGVSIGLQRWGFAIAKALPEFKFWGDGPTDRYSSLRYERNNIITDATFNEVTNNIDAVVAGISSYIPPNPEFDIARTAIVSLSLT